MADNANLSKKDICIGLLFLSVPIMFLWCLFTWDWSLFLSYLVCLAIGGFIYSSSKAKREAEHKEKEAHVLRAKARVKTEDVVRCPRCGSSQLTVNQKGFSAGKAAAGGLLVGQIGLLSGFAGSKRIVITCLQCAHKWTPTAPYEK